MNVRKNIGFPLSRQGMPRAEIRQRVEEAARLLRIDHLLDQPVSRPRRRRPPARGARPRHRAPPEVLPDGRAARHARRRVPRPHGARAARAAQPHRRDHRLRHPRPARGDGDGRQDRGDEPRRHRAVRHAAGDLRPAGLDVRRRLHRLAADELPPLPRRPAEGRRHASALNGATVAVPRLARGPAPRASSRSASAPSTSASTMPGAPRLGLRRRISRHHPDRHGRNRGRPAEGAAPRRPCASSPARRSASPSTASACRSSTTASGRAIRSALGSRAWLRSRSPNRQQDASAAPRAVATFASPSPTASSSSSSARPAPARPRRCG